MLATVAARLRLLAVSHTTRHPFREGPATSVVRHPSIRFGASANATLQYPPSIELGPDKRVRIEFAATTIDARPYNVVGFLEVSATRLKEEWISLASHLDGAVSANAAAPGNGLADQWNAADDNASGSAGNLAIVRALLAAPRPKRYS
jgi:hypothetical protein